jgi:hypothetical protein
VGVRALEVSDKDPAQVGLVVDLVVGQMLEPRPRGVPEVERQVLDDEKVVCRSPRVAREPVVLQPYADVGVSLYLGTSVGARKREGNLASRTPWPKARGPLCFGDQLRSQSSSLL